MSDAEIIARGLTAGLLLFLLMESFLYFIEGWLYCRRERERAKRIREKLARRSPAS